MPNMVEKWKIIPDFPDYAVSNWGHFVGRQRKIKKYEAGTNYVRVNMSNKNPKREILIGLHKLVAELFIGPCPEDHIVNHKDRNRRNNHVDNLEYMTLSENMTHWRTTEKPEGGIPLNSNVTILIDSDLLEKLKVKAKEDGRSLSDYVSRKLEEATVEETAKFIE